MAKRLYTVWCIILSICIPVITLAQPVANFSSNVTTACSPIVAQFTDLSTGTPTSWQWDLGNGVTSNLQNPSTTYINPGTYTVILTATNSGGSNTKTVVNYITVKASPTVNFVADSSVACPPKSILFTNLTNPNAGGIVSYLWDFGDGGSSTATNPTHNYTTAGNFNITLVATNSLGCSKAFTKNGYIPLLAIPVASFYSTNNNNCTVPATVNFNNASTNGVTYQWNFGDGNTSTLANPSHQYNTPGSYTIRLIATNAIGCSDTSTQTAFVNLGALDAAFNVSGVSVCINTAITFTNTTTPATGTTIAWDFGDGGTASTLNTSHSYATAGSYNVRMIAQLGSCADTAFRTITVNPKPVSNFTANYTFACTLPFSTQFTNSSTGAASYLWLFGDGGTSTQVNPLKTYNTAGIYTVKLISYSASGCTDTLTKLNYINTQGLDTSLFHVTALTYSSHCAPASVYLFSYNTAGGATPISFTWDYGDGNGQTCPTCLAAVHTYTAAGTYIASVTEDFGNGCTVTKTTNVVIGTKPIASFTSTPNTVCPNQLVSFTSTSTNATSYLWSFGDGDTSIAANPTHVYGVSGTYTIRLIATNNSCSDTITIPNKITVNLPTANFSAEFSCANRKLYSFHDSAVGANTYYWDFGDGNTSTLPGPVVTHQYISFGTYIVTQVVTNTASGCTDTFKRTIISYPLTVAFSSTDTSICRKQTISFSATTNANYLAYAWAFGDGGTSTSSSATYMYNNIGVYNVKLVITDLQGCKDSLIKTNHVHVTGPMANFTASPVTGCVPLNVTFTDVSAPGGAAINTRNWTFGDGQQATSGSSTMAHSYITSGDFTVKLLVTDVNGCIDSFSKANYIKPTKPSVAFFATDSVICIGQAAAFNNLSGGTGLSVLWNFGDGNTSTTYSPTHNYISSGFFTVKLAVTDNNGCKDSLTKLNYIEVKPLAVTFTQSDTAGPCPPLAVTFTNTSVGLTSLLWDLGNGSNSNLANPSTVYTYPGIYTVRLIGQNAAGCIDTATKTVKVYGPTGTLSYSPVAGCSPLTVNFSSVSSNTQSYVWDMNNGVTQTNTSSTFTYTYTAAGKYLPKLILSDGLSCLVPITGIDTIKVDDINTDFIFSPASLCDTGTIRFTDTIFSTQTTATRSWTFGDGGVSAIHNPSHFYAAPGTYQVRLIVNNATGCNDTVIKTVNVYALPNVSAGNNQSTCNGQSSPVQLLATGATTYTWSPTGGLSCSGCPNPTANPISTTTYIVTGTDVHGCIDTGKVTITVNPLPTISAGPNKIICTGTSVSLLATGGVSYTWSPSTGLSCNNCANPTANPTTTTTYTITGIDANGCSNTGTITVTVNPLPTVSGGTNKIICNGSSVILQATGGTSYSWSPSTGLSCNNCSNPTANPTTTTTYTVTGTDANGCVNTANVTVTVNPKPNISGGANLAICTGASTPLLATGGTSYSWSPSTGLSCNNCANPTANPATTTTYTVTGTDANGCINTANVTVTVNPKPNISGGSNVAICTGSSTPLLATGGTSYSWSPSTGLSCNNCPNPTANPATTTTYTVTGTDANGCSNTANVTVTVNSLPVISGGSNKIICAGIPVTLQATGGVSYTWSPSTGLSCNNCAAPSANPASTTVYTVTGTDANGCSNTANVTVTVNPKPNISGGSNVAICTGSSTPLLATGGTSYSWSPSTGLSCNNCANPTANPTTTTTYTVTGTDANGCSNTANVTVTVNPKPNISGGSNVAICTGSSTPLLATGGTSYSWSPSTGLSCTNCANPTANPTTTTTYTVTGTDANGCSNTANVTVTVNSLPVVSGGSNKTICAGGSVLLQATGGSFYNWSPATGLSCTNCNNPTANPATTTIYTVTGTNVNGCTNTAQVTVTVNPLPTVNGGGSQNICIGSSVTLQATGAVSYTWTPATGLSCTNCPNPTANPAATTTYTVTGTNANGCTNTDNVTVTVNPIPNVTASTNKAIICDGTGAQLQANGAANYTWTPAVNLSCINCPNPVATPSNSILYIVTGTTNGCSDTAQVAIQVLPKPSANAGADTFFCIGGSTILNGTGTGNLIWSPASGLSCTNCNNPVANPGTTTNYTLTVTDAAGCSNTDAVTVTVHPSPVIDAGRDTTICNGESLQLLATGAASYVWSPASGLSCTNCNNPVAKPLAQTLYKVVGVSTYGCSDSDEVSISVVQKLPTSVSPDADICIGSSTQLIVNGGDSYLWIPASGLNNATISNPVASPVVTTNYRVVIKQGFCFADTANVKVTVHEIPVVDAGPDQSTVSGTSVQLRALGTNIVRYEWTPAEDLDCSDCASPKATPFKTTTYEVIVYTSAGCSSKDNVTVNVNCDKTQLFIPNTFTPNGDGTNDKFYPQGKGITHVQHFRVFNRWGQVVFEAQNIPLNDPAYGWDGTLKNEPLNPDVFVYIINALCESGEPIEVKGDISLVR